MAIKILPEIASPASNVLRRILLIWQNPQSRKFVKVGQLEEFRGGRFGFRYLPAVHDEPDFTPLAQFPRPDEVYSTSSLPAFFANRVMSRRRETYSQYIGWLGLDAAADMPVEVLVRTGGPRATDTFHIVDDLQIARDGQVRSRFLASGIRYIHGAGERLRALRPERELQLRDEPDNPVNSRAVLLDADAGRPVGYVPDWLLDDLLALRSRASYLRVVAEQINYAAPPHLRLLCRLEAGTPTGESSDAAVVS